MILDLPLNNTTRDYSGYNNHGTVYGSCPYTDGKFGRSIYSGNGTTNYVDIAHSSLFLLNDFTIAFWFWRDGWIDGNGRFIDKKYDAAFEIGRYGSLDTIQIEIAGGGGLQSVTGILDKTWTHIAAKRIGAYCYLYINGLLDASGVLTSNQLGGTYNLTLFTHPGGGGEAIKGKIHALKMWNHANINILMLYNSLVKDKSNV